MTDPEFTERAAHSLSTAQPGDTVIVAVVSPGDSMVLHVLGRNARHMTDVARSLLEQAEDALREANPQWEEGENDQGDAPDEELLASVLEALEALPSGDEG